MTIQQILMLTELVRAAQYRGLTTYQHLALHVGLPLKGAYMGKAVGAMLGAISEQEVAAGRPMLSAVAVNVKGVPGPGFASLARGLGRAMPDEDNKRVWRRELEAVYEMWKPRLPVPVALQWEKPPKESQ